AKLVNENGYGNYIPFVVRDDNRNGGFLFQSGVTTYQAYNNFPDDGFTGKSLYTVNSYGANTISGSPSAVKVSFNRPYANNGAGDFFKWEYNLLRWLEKEGYDLVYSTDFDLHNNPSRPLDFTAFLSAGHDEYWTKPMYDAVENARDAGVHLAFFGANHIYWQARLEPDSNGNPDRTMVVYKNGDIDPVSDPALTTIKWRDLGRPEQELIGIQYASYNDSSNNNTNYVVANSNNWIYNGTGFADGDSVTNIVGYEVDSYQPVYPLPANLNYSLLSNSSFIDADGATIVANSSIYQAPSGAWVFAAGTMSWSWALDRVGYTDARIQQTTHNVLNQFLSSQGTPTPSPTPDGTLTPTPTATPVICNSGLTAEAESGVLHGAFTLFPSSTASGGQAVVVPEGAGSLYEPNTAHRVDICITAPNSGQYRIVAWSLAPDGGSDSFYVQVDGLPAIAEKWTVANSTTYVANNAPLTPSIEAGQHIVSILLREDGTRLDRIELQYIGPSVSPTATPTPTTTPPTPTPSPTAAPTNTPSPCSPGLQIEAEAATLHGGFTLISDAAASG
ncbi:MAG: hypothetical protein KDE50_22395, partial [Caldilineaceae bacterium]|nr:hypothetical protein [Caldilineaceae bacterium]